MGLKQRKVYPPRSDRTDFPDSSRRFNLSEEERQSSKKIDVGHGLFALVDAADYEAVKLYRWIVSLNRRRTVCYAMAWVDGTRVAMHKFLIGATDGMEIDHHSGNGLGNRRSNLRRATRSQNAANAHSRRGGASKFKGVHLQDGKWRARIQVNGKRVCLGNFSNEEDAARAYDRAAVEYFGEFANTNFPPYGTTVRKGEVSPERPHRVAKLLDL